MLMKTIGYLLVAVHVFLGLWGIGGVLEMVLLQVPWERFTNPAFPDWVLAMHWSAILIGGFCFLFGYFAQWRYTPHAMAVAYGFMALVCVIETFGFMTSDTKYVAMAAEYVAYAVILWMLFRARYFVEYFGDVQG